ncbi:ligase-associated DNA damage response endonuclease PdeM [Neorhodopirellula pilleata]|uniref:Calcineurin-like phosphoesterase domain-containing protein n=1 Tax=Neorhodopirellula pilleata TaxID=2714738 RepID=A0A5C5ZL53_9BACT|nr:ligase-associated DNA damage response endonuclease PdeM [Neorhodopirellula pilleata]TWT87918.1 hypothetical protein Pla100_58670 [Neorhodopirellula pilleata]
MQHGLTIDLAGQSFVLLGQKGLYWPKHRALLVADLHLGKDATFRHFGIGVPRGSTKSTLLSVSTMLESTGAEELFVLGDLCHARSSLSATTRDAFAAFQNEHGGVAFHLIEGNHDRSAGRLPDDWRFNEVGTAFHLDGVTMAHEPADCPVGSSILITGHWHPAWQLRHAGESTGKLPCFWHHAAQRCLVLPACGHFTGTELITPRNQDQLWVIVEDQVISILPR